MNKLEELKKALEQAELDLLNCKAMHISKCMDAYFLAEKNLLEYSNKNTVPTEKSKKKTKTTNL